MHHTLLLQLKVSSLDLRHGFQRFSSLQRFPGHSGQREHYYKRLIYQRKQMDQSIVLKNIVAVVQSKKEIKSSELLARKRSLEARIVAAHTMKDSRYRTQDL